MSLVWENESWWIDHFVTRPEWWNVKRSDDDPALLAYYPTPEKAERGLWTQIKPGRYLTAYLSDLTPKQVKYWAEWHAKGKKPTEDAAPATIHFAITPDEIELVYLTGPRSCMSHLAKAFDGPEHPTRVYGAGDLAIAYLIDPNIDEGDEGHVTARALCWPERKCFGRVYPTYDENGHQEELRSALYAVGYHSAQDIGCDKAGMNGARMLRIEVDDGNSVVMPYLDAPYQSFDDLGDYLTLGDHGEHAGTETNGCASLAPEYEYCCANCGEGFDSGGDTVYLRVSSNGGNRSQDWCGCCVETAAFYCEGFGELFAERYVDSVCWNDDIYTEAWISNNTFISDFSGDRFADDESVKMQDGSVWSSDEFADYGRELDGACWPNDEAELERRAAHADANQEEMSL